jgi:hypothetical protein
VIELRGVEVGRKKIHGNEGDKVKIRGYGENKGYIWKQGKQRVEKINKIRNAIPVWQKVLSRG